MISQRKCQNNNYLYGLSPRGGIAGVLSESSLVKLIGQDRRAASNHLQPRGFDVRAWWIIFIPRRDELKCFLLNAQPRQNWDMKKAKPTLHSKHLYQTAGSAAGYLKTLVGIARESLSATARELSQKIATSLLIILGRGTTDHKWSNLIMLSHASGVSAVFQLHCVDCWMTQLKVNQICFPFIELNFIEIWSYVLRSVSPSHSNQWTMG